jgi:opacity protein-like surface antigen
MTGAGASSAQAVPPVSPYYARNNTFSVFGAYSGDSSHMLLGSAENRRLLELGVAYGRKLMMNRIVNWQYNGELLPVALESDPVVHTVYHSSSPYVDSWTETDVQTAACVSGSGNYNYTLKFSEGNIDYSGTYVITCSRQWTIGEAISPVGFQWNFRPQHKLQPFFIGHGGYMYSTQPIPIPEAGSFNFTFDLGSGFELYRSKTRSVRAEYRYHHLSNHNTANQNPGVDNGLVQLTYSFGR